MSTNDVHLYSKLLKLLDEHSMSMDVISVIRRDDADGLLNLVSTQQISPQEYTNGYGQGLLQLAGIFILTYCDDVAQYDAINCIKYLVQQNICPLQEDVGLICRDDTLEKLFSLRYSV